MSTRNSHWAEIIAPSGDLATSVASAEPTLQMTLNSNRKDTFRRRKIIGIASMYHYCRQWARGVNSLRLVTQWLALTTWNRLGCPKASHPLAKTPISTPASLAATPMKRPSKSTSTTQSQTCCCRVWKNLRRGKAVWHMTSPKAAGLWSHKIPKLWCR